MWKNNKYEKITNVFDISRKEKFCKISLLM